MKITYIVFAISLCIVSCSEPVIDSDTSTVGAAATVSSEKIVQPIAEKIEVKEEQPVNESPVEISDEEKERIAKEEAKAERKRKRDEAYEKASLERKEKRRIAREEKRKREKEEKGKAKEEKDLSALIVKPKEYASTSSPEEEIDELKMKSPKGTARIVFRETEFDFGVIKQGEKIKHDFVFENVGSGDVEILNVDVTCGCTVPTFPFIPIAPGEKGTVSVTYNSTGKLGNQKPMITIVTNAKPHTYKIYFKGVVDAERAKPKEEAGSN